MALDACHIYERKTYARVEVGSRPTTLSTLGLSNLNDLVNLITLCKKCHRKFDAYHTYIHPREHRWVVSGDLRETISSSGRAFSAIHSTPVKYAEDEHHPCHGVLAHRMSMFTDKHPFENLCHLCTDSFSEMSSLDEHMLACSVARIYIGASAACLGGASKKG